MRVVFMGTPEFAVPSLAAISKKHEVLAVVTQPDRKRGRGQKVSFSPVKAWAVENEYKVWQPKRVSNPQFITKLQSLKADAVVVVAFGQLIPDEILTATPYGCINLHSSLLPKYRGASPINAAIINGEKETGVTTMYLNSQWDAGDIILQEKEGISPRDTSGTLHDRLMVKGAHLLVETLRQIEEGVAPRIPQNHADATYAYKLSKDDGFVDFTKSALQLDCLIRGMNPWPVAYTVVGGERIKIWEASPREGKGEPGRVIDVTEQGLVVGCGKGLLSLEVVQRPNSRSITGRDLANGLRLSVGDYLVGGSYET